MQDFTLIKAKSKDDALSLIKELGSKAKILAGGTDLVVHLKEDLIKPEFVIDINPIDSFKLINSDNNIIKIGPLVKVVELVESQLIKKKLPILHKGASVFGSPQIRNMATIGGNLANCSPVGDLIPALYVLKAKIKIENKDSEKLIPIEDFGIAPRKSVLEKHEIITEVQCPIPKSDHLWFFIKLGQRKGLSISKASLAFLGEINNNKLEKVVISMGSVAPKVLRGYKTEDFLKGKEINFKNITEASIILANETTPITDLRSTKEYRQNVYLNLLRKGLEGIIDIV
jgi:CO/xanthine dehydrogenase FAD-binding subunit